MSELVLTRAEAIALCHTWARMLRREYTIDTLVSDYGDGVLMSDQLAYPRSRCSHGSRQRQSRSSGRFATMRSTSILTTPGELIGRSYWS